MKILTAVFGLGLVLATTAQASDASMEKVHKEVQIMTGILQTSLAGGAKHGAAHARVSSTYLAKQGVVFNIRMTAWGMHVGNFSMPEVYAPDIGYDIERYVDGIIHDVNDSLDGLPYVYVDGDVRMEYLDDELMEEFDEEQMVAAGEGSSSEARDLRQQRNQLRQERNQLRQDYERAQTEFRQQIEQLSRDDSDRTLMEQARTALEHAKKTYMAGKKVYHGKVAQLQQERQAEHERKVARLGEDTLDALCTYGTPLRSIGAKEHITLIFKDVVRDQAGRSDLIYVIDKSELLNCQAEKISPTELLSKAESYTF